MKGQLEDAVKELGFPSLLIFQPSVLIRSNNDRGAENFSVKAIHFLNKIGFFKRYRPMPTTVLAQKMRKEVATAHKGIHTFTLDEIFL
jgi:hypothetical protein